MHDIGILASTDPVALDKACLDLVFNYNSTTGDDAVPLQQRINRQHGTHTVDYAAQIGLGSLQYMLIDIKDAAGINQPSVSSNRYNVYSLDGKKLLTNAASLDGLPKGTYIVNGEKKDCGSERAARAEQMKAPKKAPQERKAAHDAAKPQ